MQAFCQDFEPGRHPALPSNRGGLCVGTDSLPWDFSVGGNCAMDTGIFGCSDMYKVASQLSPFHGHQFNGTPIVIDGERRIWDNNSAGRSYPAGDCIPV